MLRCPYDIIQTATSRISEETPKFMVLVEGCAFGAYWTITGWVISEGPPRPAPYFSGGVLLCPNDDLSTGLLLRADERCTEYRFKYARFLMSESMPVTELNRLLGGIIKGLIARGSFQIGSIIGMRKALWTSVDLYEIDWEGMGIVVAKAP